MIFAAFVISEAISEGRAQRAEGRRDALAECRGPQAAHGAGVVQRPFPLLSTLTLDPLPSALCPHIPFTTPSPFLHNGVVLEYAPQREPRSRANALRGFKTRNARQRRFEESPVLTFVLFQVTPSFAASWQVLASRPGFCTKVAPTRERSRYEEVPPF